MKKLFTIDDIAVAFISALGYGFGTVISRLSGWPEPVCMAASFALGLVVESIVSKIAFSKAVQEKPINRFLTYITILFIFLIAQYISISRMGVSMIDYVRDQIITVVLFPILGFIINLLIRWFRVRKIRRIYGDGSEGFVFDVKKEDVEGLNQQNQTIREGFDPECSIRTKTGIYIGEKYKKTICYLGIPYAKAPIGELRWKAPEPLPASDSVFEAKNFGASAIQVEHNGLILKNHRQSEDCLSINICIGTQKKEEKKPVIVLFHHGDFTYGGSADPLMYGSNFINKHQDAVFVSFNYRLGIFGFIDFSEVPGGEAYPDALNLGLLDQIAALQWVRENIEAFGGDPERVTVLGIDAGATSILLLAASEQAKGLFQKAFVFNGSPIMAYDTPEGARNLAKDLLKVTGTTSMEELSQMETDVLKNAAQKLWMDMCAPTCDGKLIPVDVFQAFRNGTSSNIEFVIGFPGNQTMVYRSFVGSQNYENVISAAVSELLKSQDSAFAGTVQTYIEEKTSSSTELEAKSKIVEQICAIGIYQSAVKLSEGGNKVHLMYWDQKPLIENLGSGTVDATAALLGNNEALEIYGNVLNDDLSEILQNFLEKYISGKELRLYSNEIKGVDSFDWKAFPDALIVKDEKILCHPIEDKMTKVKGLMEFVSKLYEQKEDNGQ